MKKSTVARAALACIALSAAAWPQTTTAAGDILRQARTYQLQFRAGHYDVVPQYVAMLEEATKADPENADLASAMGVAYLAQAAGIMLSGAKPADAMVLGQKGTQALEHALRLNPDQVEALATHGAMQAMMASLLQAPQMASNGAAEMNRAVELAPNAVRVRLQRAFSGLSLPEALRNHIAEAEDLDFAIQAAGSSRAGAYLRIMRGDLFVELGKVELARDQYELAGQPASPAATEASARLTALAQGGVAMSDIKKLRSAAGAQCTMCHSSR